MLDQPRAWYPAAGGGAHASGDKDQAPAREAVPPDLTERLALRHATPADHVFAVELYLETMRPLLTALGEWQEATVLDNFWRSFQPDRVRIILSADQVIGWIQVTEQPDALAVNQLHLVAGHRGRGLGGRLLLDLMTRAGAEGKRVTLAVVRNNPARRLYQRLGFEVVGEDGYKLRMRWPPHAMASGGEAFHRVSA